MATVGFLRVADQRFGERDRMDAIGTITERSNSVGEHTNEPAWHPGLPPVILSGSGAASVSSAKHGCGRTDAASITIDVGRIGGVSQLVATVTLDEGAPPKPALLSDGKRTN